MLSWRVLFTWGAGSSIYFSLSCCLLNKTGKHYVGIYWSFKVVRIFLKLQVWDFGIPKDDKSRCETVPSSIFKSLLLEKNCCRTT